MKTFLTIILFAALSALFSQPMTIPHTVYLGFTDSEGNLLEKEEIYWEAWRTNYPYDVLNIYTSRSSQYFKVEEQSAGYIQVQTADFEVPLEEGDIIQLVVVELDSGEMCQVSIPTEIKNSFEMYPDVISLSLEQAPPMMVMKVNYGNEETIGPGDELEWESVDNCDGYKIYMGLEKEYMMQVADVDSKTNSFMPTLKPGKNYIWQVEPYNQYGSSIFNKVYRFKTKK